MPRDAPVTRISIFFFAKHAKLNDISLSVRMRGAVLFILILSASIASSQTDSVYYGLPDDKPSGERKPARSDAWRKKFTYGGNFQAWFGNPTFVFISPTIGY